MAELVAPPASAKTNSLSVSSHQSVRVVAPTRAKLIGKGMIYSPAHGDTAFTVPHFDAYLRSRVMPFPEE